MYIPGNWKEAPMYKKVLIPLDGAEDAERVFPAVG